MIRHDSRVPRARSARSLTGMSLLVLASAAGPLGLGPGILASEASAAAAHTLHLAYTNYDQSPDPAIFYGEVADDLELGVYQGLTTYGQNNTEVLPSLAKSWTTSSDGLTYTFHLRSGVTFHDGTPFNSAAAKYDWQREMKIGSAPSYMLDDVKSMATPNPLTFVVHLKKPNSAFLAYQASPYGPKFASPSAIKTHLGNDFGQTWLLTHDAGTGPYVLESASQTDGYVLHFYGKYWGHRPYYTTVDISIVPNETTEELELERGQIDLVSFGLNATDLAKLSSEHKFNIEEFPVIGEIYAALNSTRNNILSNKAIRLALQQALNKKLILTQTYGKTATQENQFYPAGELPSGKGEDTVGYNPSPLSKLLAKTRLGKKIVIMESGGGTVQDEMAELVQAELQADGVDASLRVYQPSVTATLAQHPAQQPDIYVQAQFPDTGNPASWGQTFTMRGAPLNLTSTNVPSGDAEINAGLTATTTGKQDADFAKAAEDYLASGEVFPLGNPKLVVVAKPDITHIAHNIGDPSGIVLDQLSHA